MLCSLCQRLRLCGPFGFSWLRLCSAFPPLCLSRARPRPPLHAPLRLLRLALRSLLPRSLPRLLACPPSCGPSSAAPACGSALGGAAPSRPLSATPGVGSSFGAPLSSRLYACFPGLALRQLFRSLRSWPSSAPALLLPTPGLPSLSWCAAGGVPPLWLPSRALLLPSVLILARQPPLSCLPWPALSCLAPGSSVLVRSDLLAPAVVQLFLAPLSAFRPLAAFVGSSAAVSPSPALPALLLALGLVLLGSPRSALPSPRGSAASVWRVCACPSWPLLASSGLLLRRGLASPAL